MWPFSSSTPAPAPPARKLTNKEAADPKINPLNPEGHKVCCACPETRKLRDDCFLKHGSNADGGESNQACSQIVKEHLKCMRSLGFDV